MITPAAAAERLEANAQVFVHLYAAVSAEAAAWKPSPERWSLLEVLCHLLDEEREDFRARLRLTLDDPMADWPPIDPEGWVRARGYAARSLAATLESFRAERSESVRWLRGLSSVAWDRTHRHPRLGSLRAGDLLGSWLAHDLLHVRQIARLHYERTVLEVAPYAVEYAGRLSASS